MKIFFLFLLSVLFSLPVTSQNIFLQPLAKKSIQNSTFFAVALSRSGDLLGLSGADKFIKIVDPATLAEKNTLPLGNFKSYAIAFTVDGKNILCAMPDGQISVWNYTKPGPINTFTHGSSIRSIDIDAAGRVISGGYDKTIKMWDYVTGKQIGKFPTLNTEIISLLFSIDGKSVLAGCSDGSVVIFDAAAFGVSKIFKENKSAVTALACSDDGKYFAASFLDSTISLFNARTGTVAASMKNRDGAVTSIAFHPNSKFLISASAAISFWDIATLKIFKSVFDTSFSPVAISISKERSILAASGRNGEIRTYKMLDKKQDVTPPVITFGKPYNDTSEPIRLYANEVEIAGIISDENLIREVTVNGTVVPTAAATGQERKGIDSSFSAVSFSTILPLTVSGINTIVVSAVDMESNNVKQELKITKLAKDASVELVNPKESIETDQMSVDLQFKIWLDFTSYTVVLNTIEIAKKENLPKRPAGTLRSEKLSLSAGLNQIQVTVNGRGGEKVRKIVNITRRMLGAPISTASDDKPIKNHSGQLQRWAVVVGVSEYLNPSIPNLSYAERDARSFAEFLKTSAGGGFEEERVKILLNKDATLNNVKLALNKFLRQTVDKDLVIIYFAGHGAPEPANPSNNYLLCYDTDPKSLETTAFPMWDVNTALTRYIPSKRVVVFTDACHSGGISTDIATRGMSATDDNLINQYLADLSKTKEGIIVFTASQAGEVSQELEKFGHGVFTYYLLEGMKGKADFNNDYTVTIGELMDYVEEKVKRQTNGNQHPTRNQGTYDKDLTISLIPH
jgi:WD40 repeat protein